MNQTDIAVCIVGIAVIVTVINNWFLSAKVKVLQKGLTTMHEETKKFMDAVTEIADQEKGIRNKMINTLTRFEKNIVELQQKVKR
jgi:ABC-type phosphate transport system permease subunit